MHSEIADKVKESRFAALSLILVNSSNSRLLSATAAESMRVRITLVPPFLRRIPSFTEDPGSSSPIKACWTVVSLTEMSSTISIMSPIISCLEFHAGAPIIQASILQPDSITPIVLRVVLVLDDDDDAL
jgi:hypothetical protein